MENTLLQTIVNAIISGGPQAFAVVGWLLYLLNTYYFFPRREAKLEERLEKSRNEYVALGTSVSEGFAKVATLLEVIKDRQGRL